MATPCEYLSFGDALFQFLERPAAPLNIASVCVFDGIINREEFCAYIESKLPLVPRFTQRVVFAPFNLGLPHWEPAPDFNIEDHVREVSLKRGTEAEFRALAGQVLSPIMDKSIPLWDFTIVRGLKGTRTGVIIRAHHSMADGISGISLLNALFSTEPHASPLRKKREKDANTDAPDGLSMLAGDIVNWWLGSIGRVLSIERDLFQIAEHAVSTVGGTPAPHDDNSKQRNGERVPRIEALSRLIPELGAPAQRFPFNKICQGPQKFTWAEISFDRIRAVKKACGVTVNDVMLAIVSCAYRDYAESMGGTARQPLRVVIPVNTRGAEQTNGSVAKDLGNQITFAPVDVPLRIRDVRKLTDELHRRTQMMKSTGLPEFVALAGSALGLVPPPVQAALASLISQLPISLCNVIFTNVPGPQQSLYLLQHKMLKSYPYVPIGGEMALNCAALTYDGNAFFGFSGDSTVSDDLEVIARALIANFEELEQSLGITPRTKPARRTPRKPAKRAKKISKPAVTAKAAVAEKPEVVELSHESQRHEAASEQVEEQASAPARALAAAAS